MSSYNFDESFQGAKDYSKPQDDSKILTFVNKIMSSDIRKHSSQRVDNETVVVLKKVNSTLTTSKIFLEIVHASHTSSWSNQFDKCSESVTRQKSIKKKTKFNIIWLKMYISGLVTTLFYKSFDFTYNTVILDQKCHQICTFWARKWWFLAFFKLFCQMSTKTSGNAVRTLAKIIWSGLCLMHHKTLFIDNFKRFRKFNGFIKALAPWNGIKKL